MIAQAICTVLTFPSNASALQSSISALERDVVALDGKSSGLEPWLGWFTLLVAIGVALEIYVVIHDHNREVREWSVCELISEGPSLRKLGIEIASIIFVIVGVMGEFGVGLKISAINAQLRGKNAELRTNSDQLVELLHGEAEQLHKDAEIEHSARVKIEASVGWRHLTEQQQQGIGMDLGIKFSKSIIGIWFIFGDIEGSRFASDIAEAMRDAKLSVWPPRSLGIGRTGGPINSKIERDPTGISVEPTTTDPRSESLASAIVGEFTSRGFDATLKPASAKPDFTSQPEVIVIVESRPEGPQGKFKLEAEREAKNNKNAKSQ